MLYGLLITLYVVVCILLVLIILIQKGKSSMGLGNLGGGSQMLFGGSGGQDIFQKITWVLGTIFIFGSLLLAMMKSTQRHTFHYVKPAAQTSAAPMTMPIQSSEPTPASTPAEQPSTQPTEAQ